MSSGHLGHLPTYTIYEIVHHEAHAAIRAPLPRYQQPQGCRVLHACGLHRTVAMAHRNGQWGVYGSTRTARRR
jgi:hypothetical protein